MDTQNTTKTVQTTQTIALTGHVEISAWAEENNIPEKALNNFIKLSKVPVARSCGVRYALKSMLETCVTENIQKSITKATEKSKRLTELAARKKRAVDYIKLISNDKELASINELLKKGPDEIAELIELSLKK